MNLEKVVFGFFIVLVVVVTIASLNIITLLTLMVMEKTVDILQFSPESCAFLVRQLLGDIEVKILLLQIVIRQPPGRKRNSHQELFPAFQALLQCMEGTGQTPAVDGHHEAQALPFGLVLLIEIADVLVNAFVEFALAARPFLQLDPFVLRLSAGHVFSKQPLLLIFPQ